MKVGMERGVFKVYVRYRTLTLVVSLSV